MVCYQEALASADRDPTLEINALQAMLSLHLQRKERQAAQALLQKISELVASIRLPSASAALDMENATWQIKTGNMDGAIRILRRALQAYEIMVDISSQYYTLVLMGDTFRQIAQYDSAKHYLARTQKLTMQYPGLKNRWQIYYYADLLSRDLGQGKKAIQELEQAIAHISRIAASIKSFEHRATFSDRIRPVFEDMTRLQMQQGTWQEALHYTEMERAFSLKTMLFSGRENQKLARLLSGNRGDLKSVQRNLQQNELALEYEALDSTLVIWLIGKDKFSARTVAVSRAELSDLTQRFGKHFVPDSLVSRQDVDNSYHALRKISKQLYNKLLRPIEAELARAEKILVIPDEMLHLIPFAALVDSDDKFLVETYRFAAFPSLEILAMMMQKRPQTGQAPEQAGFLGLINEELPFSRIEAETVAKLFARADILSGLKSDKAALLDQLNSAPTAGLIAAHGSADPIRPSNSLLNFGGEQQLTLRIPDLFGLQMAETRLVYLSSCESATGRLFLGEGLISLQTGFLVAGAQAVIANRWKIDDKKTMQLTSAFFQGWTSGLSIAGALQKAQLQTINNIKQDALYEPHPYFWAGPTLTGLSH